MAKMFYTAGEAAAKLGKSEDQIKDLVRAGSLREFRDAGSVSYKVDDVDAMAVPAGGADSPGASASGEIVLDPIDDSGIDLSASGSDMLTLEEADADDTTLGAGDKKSDSTVVPSVGVNVFDDDDLDEDVDPLAQTAVTDVAGLGLEGSGSGSGILDLTRESDDTSLGAELLDEIYSSDEDADGESSAVAMGDDTRAGLDEAVDVGAETDVVGESLGAEPAVESASAVVVTRVEYGPDAVSTGLTAAMAVAVLVLWFGALGTAALVRGISPSLLQTIYAKMPFFVGGSAGAVLIAGGLTYFIVKKRQG